ncbi:hypothetical protein B0H17DRAFT_1080423 [Mycena rosella]|uniref:Uncharacterized protein n=1 Tax=Mycena rosella TaxID=1033263 RepID=A0AAD7G7Y7_MYCRO|nr:hypothetical protein B0H17DRAFT_1080423 [Mycena rosella]
MPLLLDAMLGDYNRNTLIVREPEVQNVCETPANPRTRKYTVLRRGRRKRSCQWTGTGTRRMKRTSGGRVHCSVAFCRKLTQQKIRSHRPVRVNSQPIQRYTINKEYELSYIKVF